MKYLRIARGVVIMDKKRNQQIRSDVLVKPVSEFIEERQLNWWGRISNK